MSKPLLQLLIHSTGSFITHGQETDIYNYEVNLISTVTDTINSLQPSISSLTNSLSGIRKRHLTNEAALTKMTKRENVPYSNTNSANLLNFLDTLNYSIHAVL